MVKGLWFYYLEMNNGPNVVQKPPEIAMTIELTNGTSASRFHSGGIGELLAVFQYRIDAEKWAKDKCTEDNAAGMKTVIVVTCLYSGRSEMFGKQPQPSN